MAARYRLDQSSYHDQVDVRAYVVSGEGDARLGSVRTMGTEDLGAGDVMIHVEWSGVNYKDGLVRMPGNRVSRMMPLIPGVDLAGTVLSSEDPSIHAGSEVLVHGYDLGVRHHGGFAQQARVPSSWIVVLPSALHPRHAMCIGTAGFTAVQSLRLLEHHGLQPGQGPILVTGASGGVGSMAVSLLSRHGYEVVASTGKREEHVYLRNLGASSVISREDLAWENGRVFGPEEWAGAIDCVGGSTLGSVLRTLRRGAAVAASGLTGGSDLNSTVFPFIVRGVSLLGVDSVTTPIEVRRSIWAAMADDFPAVMAEAMVSEEIGLDGVGTALDKIGAGRVRGRILVQPDR